VIRLVATGITTTLNRQADDASLQELDHQQAKEIAQADLNIELALNRQEFAVLQKIEIVESLVRKEAGMRLDIFGLIESMRQLGSRYQSTLSRGLRLQEEYQRFRQETAAATQISRYKNMAYRIFRNDALQKYRAQFDLAAAYVYMAARAYAYETGLDVRDNRAAERFFTDVVRARAIGQISGGQPIVGGSTGVSGDGGLADPLARMSKNFVVLEGNFLLNNPQEEENRFALRKQLFRIGNDTRRGDPEAWKEVLRNRVVPDLFEIPEFRRYCRPFQVSNPGNPEPGIIIPLTDTSSATEGADGVTLTADKNFFGRDLGPGDVAYGSSNFSTKIRNVGVWFEGYNSALLSHTPRVYLIPAGQDVFRSPSDGGNIIQWTVVEQRLPIPFPVSSADLVNPADPVTRFGSTRTWSPTLDSVSGGFADIRRFSEFRAYHDSGSFDQAQTVNDSRLIGRSVWNTRWLLIIPAANLLHNREEGLDRFINNITDIKILFQTYASSGG
jgi:hypothetical protein